MRTLRTNAVALLLIPIVVVGCGGTTDNRYDSTPQNASMTNIGTDRSGMGGRAREEAQASLTSAPAEWVIVSSKSGLYAVRPDGTMTPPLPTPEGIEAVQVLPKGKGFLFAYRAKPDALYGVYQNSSLSNEKAEEWIAPTFVSVSSIQLTKDGKAMAVVAAKKEEPTKLYRATKAIRVPAAISAAQSAALNPNDDTVALIDKDRLMLGKLGSDQAPKAIVSDKGQDSDPVWLSDGKRIVFASTRGGGVASLFVVGRDGKGLAAFGPKTENGATKPALSSDGKRLVYMSPSSDGKTTVQYVVQLDGKSTPTVVKLPVIKPEGEVATK